MTKRVGQSTPDASGWALKKGVGRTSLEWMDGAEVKMQVNQTTEKQAYHNKNGSRTSTAHGKEGSAL